MYSYQCVRRMSCRNGGGVWVMSVRDDGVTSCDHKKDKEVECTWWRRNFMLMTLRVRDNGVTSCDQEQDNEVESLGACKSYTHGTVGEVVPVNAYTGISVH